MFNTLYDYFQFTFFLFLQSLFEGYYRRMNEEAEQKSFNKK